MVSILCKERLKRHAASYNMNVRGNSDRQKLRQSYLSKSEKALPYKKVMRYYKLENKILAVFNYEAAKKIPLID